MSSFTFRSARKDFNTQYFENKLFRAEGHFCEILDSLDIVYKHYPGEDFWSRIKRATYLLFTISEDNPLTLYYMKSQSEMLESKKKHIRLKTFIIHPFSRFFQYWNYLFSLIMAVALIASPYFVAVVIWNGLSGLSEKNTSQAQLDAHKFVIISSITSFAFLFNFIIRILSAYHNPKNNKIYFNRCTSLKHYLKQGWAFLDVILASPSRKYLLFIEMDSNIVIDAIVQLTLILHLRRCLRKLYFVMDCFGFGHALKVITSLIFVLLVFINWCAFCTWILFVMQNISQPYPVLNKDFNYLWNLASHQIAQVATRSGRGFMHAGYYLIGLTIIQWLLTSLFVQYIIAKIVLLVRVEYGHVFKNIDMQRQIEVFMSEKNLPRHLRERILAYYDFHFGKSFFNEAEIMAAVPFRLKQDITMHRCKKLLEQVAFFKGMPITFLARLMVCLKPEYYMTNDVIIKARTSANSMYFISSGTVAVISPEGKEICHLYDGNHVGEVILVVPNLMRTASVVAVEMCKLYKLLRSDFLKAITPFPDLMCQIENVAHQRLETLEMISHRKGSITSSSP